jgi:hypothetical protein
MEKNIYSEIAKSGHKAEELCISNNKIKEHIEKYFDKKIDNIVKIHNKKYDIIIFFNDNTKIKVQVKKIENLGGRGDSFDRRHIKDTFTNEFIRKYLVLLTIIRIKKNETLMTNEQKKDFIQLCNKNINDIKEYIKKTLLGENDKNEYWLIIHTNKNFSKYDLYMLESNSLYEYFEKNIHIDIKMKKNGTCLHLCENIVLQRKGGTYSDNNPNHIQAKLKINNKLLNIFTKIL